jgi:hypothetical protein
MIIEPIESKEGIQRLTSINLVENTDGVHKSIKNIGYVAEEPFVVLSVLLNSYFIQSYCGNELYPVGYCSFKYSLSIEDEGDRRIPRNLCKCVFHDLKSFKDLNSDMFARAYIDAGYNKTQYGEYITLLSKSKDSIDDLQVAINMQDAIQDSTLHGQDWKSYISIIKSIIIKYGFCGDIRKESLARYIHQYYIDLRSKYEI